MRAHEIQPKKLVVFDIDDTLVHTQTQVHVIKHGQVIRSLNSHDFTHYRLQPGETFDFGDFRNAREFFNNARPIIPMMDQLKHDINTGNHVVMVTARADFDDRELFLDTFRKYGVDMNQVHVYRAGNMKGNSTEEKKKIIIRNLLNQGHYAKAIMYDDAVPNLNSFMELKQEYPRTKFYAWHVDPEGHAREFARESIAESKTVHYNGLDISLEIQKDDEYVDDEDYDNQVIYVTASSNGRELGHVLFAFDGEYLMPQDLEVDERYRGQGIAATMYDYVKSRGYNIRRSGQQTAAGTGFWARHRPDQNVWEHQELTEVGNAPSPHQPVRQRKRSAFWANVEDREIVVFFDRSPLSGALQITFTVDGSYDLTGSQGKLAFRIFSTVLDIIRQRLPEYLKSRYTGRITFTAKLGEGRTAVYEKFANMLTQIVGAKYERQPNIDTMGQTLFGWDRKPK